MSPEILGFGCYEGGCPVLQALPCWLSLAASLPEVIPQMTPTPPPSSSPRIQRSYRLSSDALGVIESQAQAQGTTKDAALERLLMERALVESPEPPWLTPAVKAIQEVANRSAESLERQLSALGALHEALVARERSLTLDGVTDELSQVVENHRAWLEEIQQALSESHTTLSKAVSEFAPLGETIQACRARLDTLKMDFLGHMEVLMGGYQRHAEESGRAMSTQLQAAREAVLATRTALEESEALFETHRQTLGAFLKETQTQAGLLQRKMRLAPTFVISVVVGACTVAVMASLFFVPVFEKYSSEKLVHETITPVVKTELSKALIEINAEHQKKFDEFLKLEKQRYTAFAEHYKQEINQLSGERKRLGDALTSVAAERDEYQDYALKMRTQNERLKEELKRYKEKYFCGVVAFEGVRTQITSVTLLFLPVLLFWLAAFQRRKKT